MRHRALHRAPDDPYAGAAGAAEMLTDPIVSILAAQNPEGSWIKRGNGYGPRYTVATRQLTLLGQFGADRSHSAEREE